MENGGGGQLISGTANELIKGLILLFFVLSIFWNGEIFDGRVLCNEVIRVPFSVPSSTIDLKRPRYKGIGTSDVY